MILIASSIHLVNFFVHKEWERNSEAIYLEKINIWILQETTFNKIYY
jgi:hypothetical protein